MDLLEELKKIEIKDDEDLVIPDFLVDDLLIEYNKQFSKNVSRELFLSGLGPLVDESLAYGFSDFPTFLDSLDNCLQQEVGLRMLMLISSDPKFWYNDINPEEHFKWFKNLMNIVSEAKPNLDPKVLNRLYLKRSTKPEYFFPWFENLVKMALEIRPDLSSSGSLTKGCRR